MADKAIEAVAAHAETHDEACPCHPVAEGYECDCTAGAAQAALPTLRRLAEERREAVEMVKQLLHEALNPRVWSAMTSAKAVDDARAFLRRVEEGRKSAGESAG